MHIKPINVRILGIRNQVAYVSCKAPGYVNMTVNHLITVPAGQCQSIDPRFIVTEDHYRYQELKGKFFA